MTPYEVLNVRPNATDKEIAKAYQALCDKFNPKNYQGDLNYAQNRLTKIQEAYDTLSDPTKRKAYDTKNQVHISKHVRENFNGNDTYKEYYKDSPIGTHEHNDRAIAYKKYDEFQDAINNNDSEDFITNDIEFDPISSEMGSKFKSMFDESPTSNTQVDPTNPYDRYDEEGNLNTYDNYINKNTSSTNPDASIIIMVIVILTIMYFLASIIIECIEF